jgi:hypothetical protein
MVARGLAALLADLHARGDSLDGAFHDAETIHVARLGDGWRFAGVAPRGRLYHAQCRSTPGLMFNPPPPPPVLLVSPEVGKGVPHDGSPVDVFTLGAHLAWWATGRSPFGGGSRMDQLTSAIHGRMRGDLALPIELGAIVRAACALEPAARATAAQLRDALDDVVT